MRLRYLTIALTLAGTLTACDQMTPSTPKDNKAAEAPTAATDDSEVLATVNGTPITANTLAMYQQQRQGRMPNDPSAQNRQAILDEIISLELASQDGQKQGADKDPEFLAQMAQQRRALIASTAFKQKMDSNPITDEELKALYDEKAGSGNEYKARHILVKDKEKAESLIAELDKGADFAELAKANSTGPSGKNGGDLGWFSPKSMVKPFSDAAAGLEKGSYTKTPVKTQFGWHIILLEDTRESTPPPFEQVKPQLQMMVRNQRVQNYINELRANADIKMMETAPAPAPAATDEHAGHEHADHQHAAPAESTATESAPPKE